MQIQPQIQPYSDALNKKLLASPYLQELDQALYYTYLRSTKKNIEFFRTENIPLQAELAVQQQQFGQITGAMSIEVNGETYTLASNHMRPYEQMAYQRLNYLVPDSINIINRRSYL